MNGLHLAENVAEMRRKKEITQEELAEFVGVTKASVSKWETGQSLPDILMLPRLANYFGVTVDTILGYEPQLSREQIQKIYIELAAEFAARPFEDVMKKSEDYIKQYYSCYPFLYQMCIMWLNHYTLAETEDRQREILEGIVALCGHIIKECRTLSVCNDAAAIRAMADLLCQRPERAIEAMEETVSPNALARQNSGVLVQAYLMLGDQEKANELSQANMFIHLTGIICDAGLYLGIHVGEPEVCEETIRRIEKVMEVYDVEKLHPNTAANFYYQAAAVCCIQKKEAASLEWLKRFVRTCKVLLDGKLMLHGDSYFNRLEQWFGEFELGANPVRDEKLVRSSIREALDNPVFEVLRENDAMKHLKQLVKEGEQV